MEHPSPSELWRAMTAPSPAAATPDVQAATSPGPAKGAASVEAAVQATASPIPVHQPSETASNTVESPIGATPEVTGTVPERAPGKPTAYTSAKVDQSKVVLAEGKASSGFPFKDHQPADEEVNPALLLTEISALIRTYIIVEPEQADAATLWVAHTHMIGIAEISPLLIPNAPERACAKTLMQDVLARMSHRALHASNATVSALFRSIERWGVTLFIDEADTFFRDNPELHGMVNAGHRRGGTLLRSEAKGDTYEPKAFSVYGAKSIAGIALERHLPDSTMSRGIVLNMRRKLPHEKVERLRNADGRVFDRLASQLARFAKDYAEHIGRARPALPDELSDRAQDNWEPLLAIAGCAGPEWAQRAKTAALKLSSVETSSASVGNELLADIKEVLAGFAEASIPTVDLLKKLTSDADMGWATYNRGKPLTPRQLAKQLAVYGIKPKTVRQDSDYTPKGYVLADFQDAFVRYLQAPPPEPSDTASVTPDVAATPQPVSGVDYLDRYYVDLCAGQRGGVADTSESTGAAADDDSRY